MPDTLTIAARLEAAFAKIEAERMDGIPILNPRLKVEAVGTRDWNGDWLSVLITPWFINLMLLPGTDEWAAVWADLPLGSRLAHTFPAGRFDFLVGEEEGIGRYQMCSLFSPVLEFEDQEAARIAAEAALEALFDARIDESREPGGEPDAPRDDEREDASRRGISRRNLISGKIASGRGSV
ncbi:MAG: [NiFe]-hydrogenase assembly chaperone HybE [Hyphomicrobium sp.]|nr:[NiFe]-hydrogenase assembly chaperone HybE [Hyphomicrobium sp.]